MADGREDIVDLDLNLGPLVSPYPSFEPGFGSLSSESGNMNERIGERIQRLEEVTLRASHRWRWRQGLITPETRNTPPEFIVNSGGEGRLQTGEGSVAAEERTIENIKTCEKNKDKNKNTTDLIAKALAEDKDVEKNSHDSGSFFDCNICLEMATDPVLTCCGHLFCWPCLYEWLHVHSDTKECPVCKGEVTDMSTTPVYGRGNNTQEPNKESGLKVPPRPQARRIESFRQNIQIEEMIRRINNRLDVTREWAPNQDLEGVLIMPERTNSLANPINTSRGVRREGSGQHPLLEPSLIVQPENIVDLSQGSVASSEAEGSSAFTSLLRRRSQSQRAAALSFALTFAQRRFEAHFHSHSGRRNHEQSPPAEDRDSVSSIASVIQSESQTMDTATEIDSTVSSPSSSFRIRNDVLRVSDVDAGVSRAPRRRRLN